MIPLEKQVVSLDLARRLKELGVKQESLYRWAVANVDGKEDYFVVDENYALPTVSSALTVAELDDLLPIGTSVVKTSSDYTVH